MAIVDGRNSYNTLAMRLSLGSNPSIAPGSGGLTVVRVTYATNPMAAIAGLIGKTAANIVVHVEGVLQHATDDYTLDTVTGVIAFTTDHVPEVGNRVVIEY